MTRLPALPGAGTASDVTSAILTNLNSLPAGLRGEAARAIHAVLQEEAPQGPIRRPATLVATPRCCWCGGNVSRVAGEMFALSINGHGGKGEKVVLYWHARACLAADPLHDQWATAHSLPDGPEGDAACRAAYLAIRDRVAERFGSEGLRGCIDIRKDMPDPKQTLRGPGRSWGRATSRY